MKRRIARVTLVVALGLTTAARLAADEPAPAGTGAGEAVPKVLYIVPWKQLEPRRTEPAPPATRIERTPAPLERDAFRREVRLRRQLEVSGR